MFNEETVFVLGAGASSHYGYPTGEKLIKQVIAKARNAAQLFRGRSSLFPWPQYVDYLMKTRTPNLMVTNVTSDSWDRAINNCEDLANRLQQFNPLVIDYFLGHNPSLQPVGKWMIAWVILECEAVFNKNEKDESRVQHTENCHDWLRFVVSALLSDCQSLDDLFKNKIHFITFNYDVSLERTLLNRLSSIELFKKDRVLIKEFLQSRILHVYGSIRSDAFSDISLIPLEPILHPSEPNLIWSAADMAYQASQALQVIEPETKNNNTNVLQEAEQLIATAKNLYFLGFGFDKNNNSRLGLSKNIKDNNRKFVYFTNYEDKNSVNKKIGQAVLGDPSVYLSHNPPLQSHSNIICEKSVRTVYDALARDFDL